MLTNSQRKADKVFQSTEQEMSKQKEQRKETDIKMNRINLSNKKMLKEKLTKYLRR